jgi:hypothetical protein
MPLTCPITSLSARCRKSSLREWSQTIREVAVSDVGLTTFTPPTLVQLAGSRERTHKVAIGRNASASTLDSTGIRSALHARPRLTAKGDATPKPPTLDHEPAMRRLLSFRGRRHHDRPARCWLAY